jgi:type VI secretion system protein ImpK
LGDSKEAVVSAAIDEGDEPTVVSRRPIGPSRTGQPRRGAAAAAPAWPADEPTAAFARPDAAAPARAADAPRSEVGLQPTTALQVGEDAQAPEDVLLAAAVPLLVVIAHLRNSVQQADVAALRKEMAEQLHRFEDLALRLGARAGDVTGGRYVLCSLIDETVMTTPWGSSSSWSTNSLLNEFHSETWGGEKVFTILDRVRADPHKFTALLKLIDVCLLLGFEGKYRVVEGGREKLADLRVELGRLLRQHGKAPPRELSSSWQGLQQTRSLRSYVPLWIVFSIAGVLILSSFGLTKWRVATDTGPAEQALRSIANFN